MRTLYIKDMERKSHVIDIAFVEDIVKALDESRLLDDVLQAVPVARIVSALGPYATIKETAHG